MKRLIMAVTLVLSMTGIGFAQDPIERTGTVPNVGDLFEGGVEQQAMGDLWPVLCSKGLTLRVTVNNKDDTDTGHGRADLVAILFDGNRNQVAFADDNHDCPFTQTCGFECPMIEYQCDSVSPHYAIEIRDFGLASTEPDDGSDEMACTGGGYQLIVEVIGDVSGTLSEKTTQLGVPLDGVLTTPFAEFLEDTQPLVDDQTVPGGATLTKKKGR